MYETYIDPSEYIDVRQFRSKAGSTFRLGMLECKTNRYRLLTLARAAY